MYPHRRYPCEGTLQGKGTFEGRGTLMGQGHPRSWGEGHPCRWEGTQAGQVGLHVACTAPPVQVPCPNEMCHNEKQVEGLLSLSPKVGGGAVLTFFGESCY